MTTFYIVRHGQSQANAKGILQGAKINTPLTQKGQQQALQTKAKLNSIKFDKIYASPLLRAGQTATLLAPTCPITFDVRLKEYDYGQLDGRLESEVWQELPQYFDTQHNLLPSFQNFPSAQKFADVQNKLQTFFAEVTAKYPQAKILVVSHGFTIKLMLDWLLGIENLVNVNEPQNAGVTVFEITASSKTLLAFNR